MEEYAELGVLEFTSKRKRMTTIVQKLQGVGGDKVGGVLDIYCKGADSVLWPIINIDNNERTFVENKLDEFGGESLRTLVLAHTTKPASWWFDGWRSAHEAALRNSGAQEEGHLSGTCSKKCNICEVEGKIEESAGLRYLGVTGVEDKLQQDIPIAIDQLIRAGMKVWMLTGDNVETAINIAIACSLLEADMQALDRLIKFDKGCTAKSVKNTLVKTARAYQGKQVVDRAVVLHSSAWDIIQNDIELRNLFFYVCSRCKAVIACRLEPTQKASIVRLVQQRAQDGVLAIGDGNNDVPMILAADVGVGMRGKEGTAAAAASDYTIAQFKFLPRLALCYGRQNYKRIAELILYIWYKASMLVWTLYFFGYYNIFSGQFLYNDMVFQLHNVAFTAFPCFVVGIFDKDLNMQTLVNNPEIYAFTRDGKSLLNWVQVGRWMLQSVAHGCLVWFIPWLSYDLSSPESSGQTFGMWSQGHVVYFSLVVVSNLRLVLVFNEWTRVHNFVLWSTLAFMFLVFVFVSRFGMSFLPSMFSDYYGIFERLLSQPRFYAVQLVTLTGCMALDLLDAACWKVFFPRNVTQAFVEQERLEKHALRQRQESFVYSSSLDLPKLSQQASPQEHWHGFSFSHRDGISSRTFAGYENLQEAQ